MQDLKEAWSEEYTRRGIPSSFRKDPTKPVVAFIDFLKKKGCKRGLAADIGCGLGRNSFYLASQGFQVVGIEWLEENANDVNQAAASQHLPIQVFAQDAASKWPIESNSLDFAIDVFCYKHLMDKKCQNQYRIELFKALKSEGMFFISLASDKDGFYGPLLNKSTNPNQKFVVDPYSKISSFLYSLDELVKEFSDLFELVEIREESSTSPMYGKEYSRKVLNAIFTRRDCGDISR